MLPNSVTILMKVAWPNVTLFLYALQLWISVSILVSSAGFVV